MKVGHTARGFALIEFTDRYGAKCSLQKSSLATEDAIWFGPNDADPKIMASHAQSLDITTDEKTGWIKYPIPNEVVFNTRMHLTRTDVRKLLPHLIRFVLIGDI